MYLIDVQDHSQHALEFVKADQEILSGMIDLYLSLISQKTNEKNKVLAVISTVYAADSYCWDIRNEFSANARNRMEIWLPNGSLVYDNHWDWLVSEAKRLVLRTKSR